MSVNKVRLLILLLLAIVTMCSASDFLPAWQAFQVTARVESTNAVWVNFNIAEEYHIYQNKIKISTESGNGVKLGVPLLPDSIVIDNKDLGKFQVYEHKTSIQVPIVSVGNGILRLKVNYQGCKGLDLCYPEQSYSTVIDIAANNFHSVAIEPNVQAKSATPITLTGLVKNNVDTQEIATFFKNTPAFVVFGFFILGLLIAFTPCVFPLLPVLLGVISGKNISTRKSIILAFSYIIGGAVAYAIGGIVAASFGYNVSMFLQNTWVISVIAILFAIFAVSMFEAFDLQLPSNLQNHINTRLNSYSNHSLVGAFIIGAISTLALSPCVTAPLAGALVYISSTGNVWLGGTSLFAMGIGSGLPLMLIAVFGKKLLPKAGSWMLLIKKLLGMIMFLMAIYMLGRIIPEVYSHVLYLAWGIALVYVIAHAISKRTLLKYSFASIVSISILAFAVNFGYFRQIGTDSRFIVVSNSTDLNKILLSAQYRHQPVMLDFYADWCIACKEMDLKTFSDSKVSNLMSKFELVRIDVSKNDQSAQDILEKYKVLAPPSIVFLDKSGNVLHNYQITGFVPGEKLGSSLQQLLTHNNLIVNDDCTNNKC